MDHRKIELANWARHQLLEMLARPGLEMVLQTVSGDASFRRYFRVELPEQSYILVDAPPTKEDSRPFISLAESLRKAGLHTPRVLRADAELGFMLLEDLGDHLYLPALQQAGKPSAVTDALYLPAIEALVRLQRNHAITTLPPYDRALLHREMDLFEQWFCRRYLNLTLAEHEVELIARTLCFLENAALQQRQVAVHRDYHSRNLMILTANGAVGLQGPGILDFQDAVAGPYTYDLVSLLRDCYIRWPQDYVEKLARYYRQLAREDGLIAAVEDAEFFRDFDLMGLQRHLKVIGIFARLWLRDGKPQYLADIPLVISYFLDVARCYGELSEFVAWFETRVLPPAMAQLPKGESCGQ